MTADPTASAGETFVRVCAVADVPADGALAVEVDGTPVAVVHTSDPEDAFYAIRDVCSHADVALSEGDVDGCTIECWLHGSRFDLRTGAPTGLPAIRPVPVYPVRVEDGSVLVSVPARVAAGQQQESRQ